MGALKSLTFTALPKIGANPILDRRTNMIARLEEQKCLLNETPHSGVGNLLRPGTRSSAFRDATGRGQLYTIRPITQPRETSPQSVVSSLARVERQVRRCAPH